MKPYYQDELVTIYHGDCAEIIPILERAGTDQVVTSPPFNANFEYEQGMWKTLPHYRAWLCARMTALFDICAPGAWINCEIQDLHVSPEHSHALPQQKEQFNMATSAYLTVAMDAAGFYYKGETIWDRGRWMNNMAGKMACAPGSPALLTQHSRVLFFRKPGGRTGAYEFDEQSKNWKAKWCRTIWNHVQPESDRFHPAVMPYRMAHGLILGWSLPDSTILDPFMGRGTVLKAAKKLGRKAIGIDLCEAFCELAAKRMSQEVLNFVDIDICPKDSALL